MWVRFQRVKYNSVRSSLLIFPLQNKKKRIRVKEKRNCVAQCGWTAGCRGRSIQKQE